MANKFVFKVKTPGVSFVNTSFSKPWDDISYGSGYSESDGQYRLTEYTWNDISAWGSLTISLSLKDEIKDSKIISSYSINLPSGAIVDCIQKMNSDEIIITRIGSDMSVPFIELSDIVTDDIPIIASIDGNFMCTKKLYAKGIDFRSDKNAMLGALSCAVGNNTKAIGSSSFSQGRLSIASGTGSHAEGNVTISSAEYSHAEGSGSKASGTGAHAEGANAVSSGRFSHAEGFYTVASNEAAHAEGYYTSAVAYASHAEGCNTKASNMYLHVSGKYNTESANETSSSNTNGDALVIGNGTSDTNRSNAFRVTFSGAVYGTGEFNTSGADYAEFFEWQDGNPNIEDRVGRFVTLDGEFIRYASKGDYILGIVSGNPAVVGNSDEDYKHRWLKDDFGRFVREYLETSEELIDTSEASEDALEELRNDPEVEEREGEFYRKIEVPTDHVTDSWRFKQSPDYNPDQPYTERKDRSEWDYVGMLGVLAVYDDGTCEVNSYCQCGENGIATKASMAVAGQSFRVIKRIAPNIVKVVFR